ncbi:MAG TPA: DUF2075 domain-containing protein [Saprospiraceae bacterium]|jgi:hypothetical protein|nr:DUF2075 domain-containing protein [Saprospiraceae bacterium]HMT70177.1 DUF2075 domain-containing protein [Saprospiraceae bacterium]
MLNYYYKDQVQFFINSSVEEIIGKITLNNQFDTLITQNKSWKSQIILLQNVLKFQNGTIFFEFSIPRMGRRVDCILILKNVVFVIEFKVGEKEFLSQNIEQVWDYALDLKNFHKPSHNLNIVPILIATESLNSFIEISFSSHNDNLVNPIKTNARDLKKALDTVLEYFNEDTKIDDIEFATGSYSPTPTIIEAAISLFNNHSVENITRSDSGATNLRVTTKYVSTLIEYAKQNNKKLICFVTGVPGAGKTLVGLNVAIDHLDKENGDSSVFLSGNAPLVAVLQEALTRDKVLQEKLKGFKLTKKTAREGVKAFIQIIHHYRDEYLRDKNPPYDHVAIFDEAQRAWNKEQTIKFMQQKKGQSNFEYSEPEFLISCLDRHKDWAVVVCLVGGGQEINTGEAGISEWLNAIKDTFSKWETYISPHLIDKEYDAIDAIKKLEISNKVFFNDSLHLSVSMRSFRSEKVSMMVKSILDLNIDLAKKTYSQLNAKYPIVITRNLNNAKDWLKKMARGSERYGIVVSSQAYRLKPLAIDVKSPMNPVNWFLEGKDDIRSSYFLEDVATEFQVQGLELDWSCVTWDGDLRYTTNGWKTYSFVGNKWQNINKDERKKYLLNAYRVLLTRARQGMIIVVPEGDINDHTRQPEYYNDTYSFLKMIGINEI